MKQNQYDGEGEKNFDCVSKCDSRSLRSRPGEAALLRGKDGGAGTGTGAGER